MPSSMRRWSCLTLTCLALSAPAAEDTLLVTGTRTEQPLARLPMAATVLTRTDIEQSQAQDLPELLSTQPGFDVRPSGAFGKQTGVFLRGAESDHVLVLLDGVRISSLSSGAIPWEHVPLEQVQRIEIVRGPRAALWGADAMAGVVQIFTSRPARHRARGGLAFGAGRWDTRLSHARLHGGREAFSFSGDLSHQRASGFDSRIPDAGFAGEPDRDGYSRVSARLGADYRRDDITVSIHALRSSGDVQYDGLAQNHTDHLQETLGARLLFSPSARFQSTLHIARGRDEGDNYRVVAREPRSQYSRFNTSRLQLSWQNDFTPRPGQQLSAGLDYHNELLDSTTRYAETRRYNQGLFLAWQGQYGHQNWHASARWDDNQAFGGHGTGSLAWGWRWRPGQYLHASYGSAFKAPSFNELYFPGFGNPQLRPESSSTWELGLRGEHALGDWQVNLYRTSVTDLIAGVPSRNINRARIDGVEVQWRLDWRPWQGTVLVEWLDPREQGQGPRLLRRSAKKMTLDLAWQSGPWRAGAKLRGSSHYDDFGADFRRTSVSGFVTVGLRAEYAFTPSLVLRGRLENVLDKQYQLVRGYRTPSRHLFFSLHYQWQL